MYCTARGLGPGCNTLCDDLQEDYLRAGFNSVSITGAAVAGWDVTSNVCSRALRRSRHILAGRSNAGSSLTTLRLTGRDSLPLPLYFLRVPILFPSHSISFFFPLLCSSFLFAVALLSLCTSHIRFWVWGHQYTPPFVELSNTSKERKEGFFWTQITPFDDLTSPLTDLLQNHTILEKAGLHWGQKNLISPDWFSAGCSLRPYWICTYWTRWMEWL